VFKLLYDGAAIHPHGEVSSQTSTTK